MNLCGNAAHAMRPQGGTLSLTVTREQHPGPASSLSLPAGAYYCLSVRDTGHGMTSEIKERIFDPFFTTKKHGTGLGLFVTRKMVADHGGEVTFRSVPDEGSVFEVALPIG